MVEKINDSEEEIFYQYLHKHFFASKLWDNKDIAEALAEKGFSTTAHNIAVVRENIFTEIFEQTTENEWEEIYETIQENQHLLE